MATTVETRVAAILADVLRLPVETLAGELTMEDTDRWDSLTHMELIAALERSFDLELSFEDIVRMKSQREIVRLLREKGR